jgi:hypothetical protein
MVNKVHKWRNVRIHTYIHTYIHICIHIQVYIPTYRHTEYIHTGTYIYIRIHRRIDRQTAYFFVFSGIKDVYICHTHEKDLPQSQHLLMCSTFG